MTVLYDWGRWFADAKPPAKDPVADGGLIPARSRHPAEIVNVTFRKAEGIHGGIDRIFTFRITSGPYNNHTVNYNVKASKPGKIRPLLDVVMPDTKERGDILVSRNANDWLRVLRGRSATIVVEVFKQWNYVGEIRS